MIFDTPEPIVNPFFLDCGAHSVHTGVVDKLPIEKYVKFINEFEKKFCLIASPDVVGDAEATKENFEYFIPRITVPKEKILSVYHLQTRDITWLDRVLDYTLEAELKWIAIGGALGVGFTNQQKLVALEYVFKRMEDRGIELNVHLFGITDPLAIQMFRPNSVDSANFIYAGKLLGIYDFDETRNRFYRKDLELKKMSRKEITEVIVDHLMEYQDILVKLDKRANDRDFIFHQFEKQSDAIKSVALSGLNVVKFEKLIRKKLDYDFIHFITCPDGYLRGYKELVGKIFGYIWRDRGLVSYASYWDMDSSRLEQCFNVVGEIDEDW